MMQQLERHQIGLHMEFYSSVIEQIIILFRPAFVFKSSSTFRVKDSFFLIQFCLVEIQRVLRSPNFFELESSKLFFCI